VESVPGSGSVLKKLTSGAKAHFDIAVFMYGLKPVPFTLKTVKVGAKAPTYQPVPFTDPLPGSMILRGVWTEPEVCLECGIALTF
jgi:hypothetical protein